MTEVLPFHRDCQAALAFSHDLQSNRLSPYNPPFHQYPAENDYNEYLSQNNGASNAFTALDETVYHFDVHPPSLPGALDRFAQFFIAPLFTDSCTEREILAVDSENKKNLQSDMWRLYQLEKSTSSRKHWYWRFGTGNKETLWDTPKAEGRNVRDELLKWYDENYSANVMKLVVLGKGACVGVLRPLQLLMSVSITLTGIMNRQNRSTTLQNSSSILSPPSKIRTCPPRSSLVRH